MVEEEQLDAGGLAGVEAEVYSPGGDSGAEGSAGTDLCGPSNGGEGDQVGGGLSLLRGLEWVWCQILLPQIFSVNRREGP